MATLYVSYFGSVDKHCAGDPIKSETVTTSGTSAASGAIPDGTSIIKIQSDAAHYVTIGLSTPTAAATNSAYVGAGEVFWLRTASSTRAAQKVAAITA